MSAAQLNESLRVKELIQEASSKLKMSFNIDDILCNYRCGNEIKTALQTKGFVTGNFKKIMSNILNSHIQGLVTPEYAVVKREAMAIAVVASYPMMAKTLYTPTDKPWYHWFNPCTNTGYLENSNVGSQRQNKKTTGKGTRKSKKTPGAPRQLTTTPLNRRDCDIDDPDPPEFTRNVTEAKGLLPTIGNKSNIMNLMNITFDRRRHQIEFKEVTTTFVLNLYPHFLSYHGEVIEYEFRKLEPARSSLFLRSFGIDFVPNLMRIAAGNHTKYAGCNDFADDVLNALLVLLKHLPTPRRTYEHEAKQPLHANISDVFHVVPVGTDPKVEAEKKRTSASYPVQPYVMAMGNPRSLLQLYVVCNGEPMALSRGATPSNAIDLLFKTFYVLNVFYPLGWKNVFRFLQVHIYTIPSSNPRESTFDDQLKEIQMA